MPKRLHKILAINPGTRYIGTAAFFGFDLIDWRVRNVDARTGNEKIEKATAIVSSLIDEYEPDILVIKRLCRFRSSVILRRLAGRIKQSVRKRNLKVYQYSIKDVETFFSPQRRINKRQLAGLLTLNYPALLYEFNKETGSGLRRCLLKSIR